MDIYKDTLRVRDVHTHGGWFCEADMKKPSSEGGLGLSQLLAA